MTARLTRFLELLRTNYWLVPASMGLGAAVLAFATGELDRSLNAADAGEDAWGYAGGPDGAREVLSTVAGSMISVAGVVFSITIVALTMATAQYGPRLLRNFIRDRGNQFALGTFVATFVYCLIVLRSVRGRDGEPFTPHVGVAIAVLLAVASLGVLITFIHKVAVSIQASSVIDGAAEELMANLRSYADDMTPRADRAGRWEAAGELPDMARRPGLRVAAQEGGYLDAVDSGQLLAAASERGGAVRVLRRVGDFVVAGEPLAEWWGDGEPGDRVRGAFIVSGRRTQYQDLDFSFTQLTEIALRALSPSINDPFTAVRCIDRLTQGLCQLAGMPDPPRTAVRCIDRLTQGLCQLAGMPDPPRFGRDGRGTVRVERPAPPGLAEILRRTFGPVRECGKGHAAVLARLVAGLAAVGDRVGRAEDREELPRQAGQVMRAAQRGLPEAEDREPIERAAGRLAESFGEGRQ